MFFAIWAGTSRSVAHDVTLLHAEGQKSTSLIVHASRECCAIVLVDMKANNRSVPGSAEEESEDEDNTGKEDIYHKFTSFHLSLFLQQLYGRQNAIFREHHVDIELPPPRS